MNCLKWLDKNLEEVLMSLLMSEMVFIMGLQVFMRYLVGYSLSWPEELTRYSFIWLAFIGSSFATKHDIHLRIDVLETVLPILKKPLKILGDITVLLFFLYIIPPGIMAVRKLIAFNQTSAALNLPIYFVYISLIFGAFLCVFRSLQRMYRGIKLFWAADRR